MKQPEAGCNCRHLPDSATCWECSDRSRHKLVADGGELVEEQEEPPVDKRADVPEPNTPEWFAEIDVQTRVEDIERRLDKRDQVATDIFSIIHSLQDRVDELEDQLDEVGE